MTKTSNSSVSWLKAKDLVQSTCDIHVKNNTSSLPVRTSVPIELAEVAEDGLSLKMPKNACSQGHLLLIQLSKKTNSPLRNVPPLSGIALELVMTAKVVRIEALDEVSAVIAVKFYQTDLNKWSEFLKRQADRQGEINGIVEGIRG